MFVFQKDMPAWTELIPSKLKLVVLFSFNLYPSLKKGKEGGENARQVTYSKREQRNRVNHFKISYIQSASGKTSA